MNDEEDALELPVGTEVYFIPGDTRETPNNDYGAAIQGRSWKHGLVLKSKTRCVKIAGQEDNDPNPRLCHKLDVQDGDSVWVDFQQQPFFLTHPTDTKEVMGMQLSAVEAQDHAVQNKTKKEFGNLKEQRDWMNKVKNLTSLADVAELALELADRLDAFNISAVLSRFARSAFFRNEDSDQCWAAIDTCIDRVLADALHGHSPRGIANICWAIAKLGLRRDKSKRRKANPVPRILEMAAARAISDMRRAAIKSKNRPADGNDIWAGWKPQEVANFCWAVPRGSDAILTGSALQRFMSAVAQATALSKWKGFSAQEMANTISALCATDFAPPPLVRYTLGKASRNMDMFKPQEICLILQSATRAGAPRVVTRPMLKCALAAAAAADLHGYNPIDMSNLMWVLSAFDKNDMREMLIELETLAACADFVNKVTLHAKQRQDQWSATEMAGLVFSLSKLRLVDAELLNQVCRTWCDWLDAESSGDAAPPPFVLSPQTLASLAVSLASLGHEDVGLMTRICRRVRASLREKPADSAAGNNAKWDAQTITNVLWASSVTLAISYQSACDIGAESQKLAKRLRALLRTTTAEIQAGQLHLIGKHKTMLHTTWSALRAWGHLVGCDQNDWTPPEECTASWLEEDEAAYNALSAQERRSSRSEFHKALSTTLSQSVLPQIYPGGWKKRNEVNLNGFVVDILVTPMSGQRITVEADGPLHFIQPVDSISNPSPERKLNGKTRLKQWLVQNLENVFPVSVAKHDLDNFYRGDKNWTEHILNLLVKAHTAASSSCNNDAKPELKSQKRCAASESDAQGRKCARCSE